MTASKQAPKKRGRPTDYQDSHAERARQLCERLGATDHDLALAFGVHISTIHEWKLAHPEFSDALRLGKQGPDDRVERTLFARAVGYTFPEEQLFHYQGQIIRADTLKHVPPDVTACLAWLNNRRPDRWRQRPDPTSEAADAIAERLHALSQKAATAI